MRYKTKKKYFNILNDIITFIEEDKFAQLALWIMFIWMVIIIIGLWQTKADYITHTTKKQTVVWWYTWGSKAITLNNKLIRLWYSKYHSALIITFCKKGEKNWTLKWWVVNCIIAIAGIWVAESWAFKHCYRWQCMWVKVFWFKSLHSNLKDWLVRYNKYWYTWRWRGWASFFYSINWRPSLSRYCTEERSSGMKKYSCPNWYRTFNKVFRYLK